MKEPKTTPADQQVERLKEEIQEELNNYFAALQEGIIAGTIKIEDVERMLGEQKESIDLKLREATGEVMSEKLIAVEKNDVPNAINTCENKSSRQA